MVEERHDATYAAIGRVIVGFARVEFMAHRLAWLGINGADEDAGRLVTERMGLGAVLDALERFAKGGRFGRADDGLDVAILAFVNRCRKASDKRNRYAHSYVDENRIGRIRDAIREPVPLLALTEVVDLDEVSGLLSDFDDLREDAIGLWRTAERARGGG